MTASSEDMERLQQRPGSKRIWIVVATIAVVVAVVAVAAYAGWFSPGPTAILGAGATFPYPLIAKWASVYNSTTVRVNYQGIGSGGGIQQITAKTVDFAASDVPLKPSERAAAPGVLHIPVTVGSMT